MAVLLFSSIWRKISNKYAWHLYVLVIYGIQQAVPWYEMSRLIMCTTSEEYKGQQKAGCACHREIIAITFTDESTDVSIDLSTDVSSEQSTEKSTDVSATKVFIYRLVYRRI